MDGEKVSSINQLRTRFPALSLSEARALLEKHNWNVIIAGAEAEQKEKQRTATNGSGGESYFVGGGDKGSGQQVMAPPGEVGAHKAGGGGARLGPSGEGGEGGVHSLIDSIFQKAKEDGAKQGEEGGGEPRAFYGRGQRLGYTANPSPYIASTLRAEKTVNVTVYRNGFQINDDVFIPLESDDGRQFLEAMDKGFVPASLAARYPNTDLSVNLRDCLQVDYTPPAYTAFQGQGHRLAAAPANSTAPAASGSPGNAGNASYDLSRIFEVHEDEEKSFVVLLNTRGERKQFEVNPSRHTVEDLYSLAHSYQPEVERFILVERGMPPRRMEAATRPLTIAAAKLARAVLAIQET
jgi:UBX domain-containing protein 1